jgi:hypothetical protein
MKPQNAAGVSGLRAQTAFTCSVWVMLCAARTDYHEACIAVGEVWDTQWVDPTLGKVHCPAASTKDKPGWHPVAYCRAAHAA